MQTRTSAHRRPRRSFAARLFARERALFFAVLVIAGPAAGLGAPVDFVLFGLVWHVPLAYVTGFIVRLTVLGWQPIAEDAGPAPPLSRPPDVITMR